ncbi:ATP synthase F1 subunit epsilon [Collinsella tanakaei]|uniref:ATP synthase F1 subunit epsilon n=1 Tax=Collinsella tanakaei TaxID=626935 RepID=UPI003159B7C7
MAMHLRIVCPDSCAFDGPCAFVTIPTTDGQIGIAPLHASEITTIAAGYVRACDERMGSVDHVFAVSGGYVQIANDEIVVLADRAADVASVDAAELQAKIKGFEDQLSVLSESDAHRAYLYNEIAWCKLLLAA